MEDGLRAMNNIELLDNPSEGLNPCCYGRWSQRLLSSLAKNMLKLSLNPCCYGRWSQSPAEPEVLEKFREVLILVVMEDGLREFWLLHEEGQGGVLILVVMEDGLRVLVLLNKWMLFLSLNPCCYGRWSQRAKNAM